MAVVTQLHIRRVDEVQQFLALAAGFHLLDAVGNPPLGQTLELGLPEAVDLDRLEIDRLQRFTRRALRRDRENRGKKRQGKQDGNGGSDSSHGDSLF